MPSVELNRPYADPVIPDRYETIRSSIRSMRPEDVSRQLPNLVELISEYSSKDKATIRFVIGVSFSKNETPFDYRLDRIVEEADTGRNRHETLKSAIDENHLYLVFAYPADPHFDAETLRGALLCAIEDESVRTRQTSTPVDSRNSGNQSSILSGLKNRLGLGTG